MKKKEKMILVVVALVLIVATVAVFSQHIKPKKTLSEVSVELENEPELDSDEEETPVVTDAAAVAEEPEEDKTEIKIEDAESEPVAEPEPEEEEPESNGYIVVIDPGHQKRGDNNTEPNGPGSGEKKARVTGGTRGTTTGVYEYELNLEIGLALRDELEGRGYTVYMTREEHDVNISNKERAEFANDKGADITVRIHANGSESSSTNGALVLVPSSSNKYVSGLAAESKRLGKCILDSYCEATGMKDQGVQANDTMTGINWCEMPVTIIEMGFMTNPDDDRNMSDADFQKKMVKGIADGIDEYFA